MIVFTISFYFAGYSIVYHFFRKLHIIGAIHPHDLAIITTTARIAEWPQLFTTARLATPIFSSSSG
jgi:hypothetical protein